MEIPKISDALLLELSSRIAPLYFSKTGLRKVKVKQDVETLRNTSYIWGPKLGSKMKVENPRLSIKTYHTCGYYGFFKPSIAEVLSQIPEEAREWCKAFVLDSGLTIANIVPSGNLQFTTTHLFD